MSQSVLTNGLHSSPKSWLTKDENLLYGLVLQNQSYHCLLERSKGSIKFSDFVASGEGQSEEPLSGAPRTASVRMRFPEEYDSISVSACRFSVFVVEMGSDLRIASFLASSSTWTIANG